MEILGAIWNEAFLRPMTNGMVILYAVLGHNFGFSIILFTVVMRVVTIPLTVRQLRASKAMSQLQPKLKEIQARYAKDKRKQSEETMRLYREQGINPLGCLGPMLIQFPIWIALYYSLVKVLPTTPESLIGLSSLLYSGLGFVNALIPLNQTFWGLDLSQPDPTPLVLPVLVGVSMWAMQKMSTFPTADPRQAQTNQIMLWMMPIMFAFFTLQFPSGLALYWVVSNLVGIVVQYFITGWGGLLPQKRLQTAPAAIPQGAQPPKELIGDGKSRDERQERRRGRRAGPKAARRKSGGGGDRGPEPR